MYESFYGLSRRPFSAIPSVESFFPSESIEQARQALIRTIERAEGVGMVVGPAGTGKTLLCQVLAEYFRDQLRVVLLANAPLSTRRALLQSILFELRLPFRNLEEGELRLALMDHLDANDTCPSGMLLILDEAHTTPLRLLEELRLITNLVRDGEPRIRLILAGSSLLEEHLAHPRLESFNQRIAARCYLHPFHRHEVARYVRQAFDRVGADADAIMTGDAYTQLARITDGIPRLVNQVCDHALLLACSAKRQQIDAHGIEEAWADLQRLPAPSSLGASRSDENSHEGVIEFGPLDEVGETPEPAGTIAGVNAELEMASVREEATTTTEYSDIIEPMTISVSAMEDSDRIDLSHFATDDPFGGPFADEEVVIDRFITWNSQLSQTRPRVSNEESLEFAHALATLDDALAREVNADGEAEEARAEGEDVEHQLVSATVNLSELVQRGLFGTSELLGTEPSRRPPLTGDTRFSPPVITIDTLHAVPGTPSFTPEILADLQWWDAVPPAPNRGGERAERTIGLWTPNMPQGDDRDIILIDEEPRRDVAVADRPRASRQEYRHLFGRLRHPE